MDETRYFKNIGLDAKDLKIMYELDINSRQSNSSIGKKVRLEKSVVAYRIKRLVEKGFIKKFYTIIDTGRLGYRGYRIYLKWQFINEEKEREIIRYLIERPFTWWVGTAIGEWSLGFVVWAKDFEKFEHFWFDFFDKYQSYIQRKDLAIYSKLYSCPYSFLSPSSAPRRKFQIIGSYGNEKISRKERKVLSILAENARMPIVEISQKTRVSISGVKYMIKKLKDRGIIGGFRIQFDNDMLGFSQYKINFYLNDLQMYKNMLEFALAHPNVIYVPKSIGFAEFEAEIMARNVQELEKFIKLMLNRFSSHIRHYEYFVFKGAHKIRYW